MKDLTQIERPPELSDGRLRLRALRPEHKPAVVRGLNDPECGRFLWQPPYPYTEADFDDFLDLQKSAWAERREAFWTITDDQDGGVLGAISMSLEERRQTGEIGYWCGPWARSRGVMTAAVRLVRDWAFDDLGLERLVITAEVDNIASQRVALAAGFSREGVMRGYLRARGRRTDDVLYGMLPGDPRPGPGASRPSPDDRPGLGWPRLTDGRLVVRPFEPEDAPAVQAACDDSDIAHWIFRLPTPYALSDAEGFIDDARRRLVADESARLAIEDAASGELLGSVGLSHFADRQAAELGYWVKKEVRRRGVALGAARLVVAWAFGELGVERLELLTYPGNEASQALAARLGFTRECLLRGFLAPEPGKSREGRALPAVDGSLPPRDDQVQFVRLRSDPVPHD
ncbi:MAG: GNAT family N-acetyltransferase [Deltaproteobacteria bacterium]